MSDDIVVISDAEEYHFIRDDGDDDDDDDEIAFVGHGRAHSHSHSHLKGSARAGAGDRDGARYGNGAVAGPSTRSSLIPIPAPIPIFIDSDDDDDAVVDAEADHHDPQDIHTFLSADLGVQAISTDTGQPHQTEVAKGQQMISRIKATSTGTATTGIPMGNSNAAGAGPSLSMTMIHPSTDIVITTATGLNSSRRRAQSSTASTARGPARPPAAPTVIDVDVDSYDRVDYGMDIQLVESVMSRITTTTTTTAVTTKSTTRKGKAKATAVDLVASGDGGDVEVVVNEVRSRGRAFEDIQDEFDRFESSLLGNLDCSASTGPPTANENTNVKNKVTGVTSQRELTKGDSVRSSSAIKEAIEKEKAKVSKKKRKSSSADNINSPIPSQLKELDVAEGGKKRKKSNDDQDDPAKKLSKEEKEAKKAQERAEKQLARDTQKAAKEAEKSYQRKLAEVNRLRTSKNDTVREIRLYLSADLSHPTSPIAGALPEIKTRITDSHSELHFLPEAESPISGVIRFKRHLKARWDATKKHFIPLDEPKWVWEPSILMIINAEEIVDRIADISGDDKLSNFIADVRLTLGLKSTDQMMVMIKGLNKYYSKTKSLANKEFTAAARAGLAGSAGANGRTSAAVINSRPDKETIEMELVKLQVKERCFLVHVEKTEDIEDWVYNIAADVALRPYKLISKSHLNFCPTDSIKRKSSNPTEAFELMLQEVTGITPSAAMGIAVEYPTFYDLMTAYEKAERRGGIERAEGMLQDCQIKTLRNGTANGRKLNKALAKRVYNVFRGEDSLALA
ncbi:hypothetical protein IAU59_000824 [Kwoniella sp. CBS 9459]